MDALNAPPPPPAFGAFAAHELMAVPVLWQSIGGRSMSASGDEWCDDEGDDALLDVLGVDAEGMLRELKLQRLNPAAKNAESAESAAVATADALDMELQRMASRDISMSFYDDEEGEGGEEEEDDEDEDEEEGEGDEGESLPLALNYDAPAEQQANTDAKRTQNNSATTTTNKTQARQKKKKKKKKKEEEEKERKKEPPTTKAGLPPPPPAIPAPRNQALLKSCQPNFDVRFLTNFFGCYWRNRNQNLLGFPFVRGQTVDYAEYSKQDDFDNDPASSNSNGDRVRLVVRLPAGYDKARISLTARITPVSAIEPNESLLGRIVRLSELEQILSSQSNNPKDGEIIVNLLSGSRGTATALVEATAASVSHCSSPSDSPLEGEVNDLVPSAAAVAADGRGGGGGGGGDSGGGNMVMNDVASIHNANNTALGYIVALKPKWTWKYGGPGGRQRGKEKWTHTPVLDLAQAKSQDSMASLHVLVFSQDEKNPDQALCVSSLYSPSFFVGSTRHLRRSAQAAAANGKALNGTAYEKSVLGKKKRPSKGDPVSGAASTAAGGGGGAMATTASLKADASVSQNSEKRRRVDSAELALSLSSVADGHEPDDRLAAEPAERHRSSKTRAVDELLRVMSIASTEEADVLQAGEEGGVVDDHESGMQSGPRSDGGVIMEVAAENEDEQREKITEAAVVEMKAGEEKEKQHPEAKLARRLSELDLARAEGRIEHSRYLEKREGLIVDYTRGLEAWQTEKVKAPGPHIAGAVEIGRGKEEDQDQEEERKEQKFSTSLVSKSIV